MILTLAFGIGLNAAMYGLLSRLFLQAPPHIEDPEGVHRVWLQERFFCTEEGDPAGPTYTREGTDWVDFTALRADTDRLGAVGGTRPRPMQNGRGQRAEELHVSWVTGEPALHALAELFPDLPANRVRSLPAVFAPRIRSWTVGTGLFAAAALLALLLAALGLYAVIAFGVRQRELEFGIRRALGARAWDLLRMVMARGLAVTAVGVAAGVVGALSAGGLVAPLLFEGRSPRDPLALTAAALLLLTVAACASLLPARRATRADPRQALQAE